MKKLLFILFLLPVIVVHAQFPIPQGLGGKNTMVSVPGALTVNGIVYKIYKDTLAVNDSPFIKGVPDIQIITGDSLWKRNKTATQWVLMWPKNGSGGSSLPNQTNHDGRVLYTNGFIPYWASLLAYKVNNIAADVTGNIAVPTLTIFVGSVPPATVPEKQGDFYIDSVNKKFWFANSNNVVGDWTEVSEGIVGWSLIGNNATDTSVNFIGTKDNKPLWIGTNNKKQILVNQTGDIGIGTNNPIANIDIKKFYANILLRPDKVYNDPDGTPVFIQLMNPDANSGLLIQSADFGNSGTHAHYTQSSSITTIQSDLLIGSSDELKLKPLGNLIIDIPSKGVDKILTSDINGVATWKIKSQYKVWTGYLQIIGSGAPTVTIFENTLGGDIVFARTSAGVYTGTLNGAFTVNKTFLPYNGYFFQDGATNHNQWIIAYPQSANYFNIRIYDVSGTATPNDNTVVWYPLEIRVYN